jgi:hypothetical protein
MRLFTIPEKILIISKVKVGKCISQETKAAAVCRHAW